MSFQCLWVKERVFQCVLIQIVVAKRFNMYFSLNVMVLALHVIVGISMEIMGLGTPLISTIHCQSLISVLNISHCQANRCSEIILGKSTWKITPPNYNCLAGCDKKRCPLAPDKSFWPVGK